MIVSAVIVGGPERYNKGDQLPGNLHPMQEKHQSHSPNHASHKVSLTTSRAQSKKVISRSYRRAAQNTMSCNKVYEVSMWASTKHICLGFLEDNGNKSSLKSRWQGGNECVFSLSSPQFRFVRIVAVDVYNFLTLRNPNSCVRFSVFSDNQPKKMKRKVTGRQLLKQCSISNNELICLTCAWS